MAYINTVNLAYPLTLRQVKRLLPNVALPQGPDEATLNDLGFATVQPTERPTGDVVTEGTPEQQADGTWRQTWDVRSYNAEEEAAQLKRAKEQKRTMLDAARDAAFTAGMPYTFGDDEDVVQTRPQDQINLMGLASKAQRQLAAGDDTLMPFRGLSNVTRMLTPTDMDAMAMAALGHIEGVYGRSWERKDAVASAESLGAVEGIGW